MNKYEKFHKKVLDNINSGKRVSPLKAIRAHCLECLGFDASGVKDCRGEKCLFYKFRLGKNETGKKNPSQDTDDSPSEGKIERKT
ncbi:hypothetical protein L6250_03690 [Candidatus Parcubacteria bacterium]|nr:hypothetical protein [Candidatus Parcubacteria bacterium]